MSGCRNCCCSDEEEEEEEAAEEGSGGALLRTLDCFWSREGTPEGFLQGRGGSSGRSSARCSVLLLLVRLLGVICEAEEEEEEEESLFPLRFRPRSNAGFRPRLEKLDDPGSP